jgi:beta-glucosidase
MPASCFYREGDDFSATQPFALERHRQGKVAIANIKYQMSGKPNASSDYKTVSVTPDKLNESWSISWWTERHEEKLAEAKQLGKSAQWSSSATRSPRAGKRAARPSGSATTSR